jgi:hypothetical protein
VKNIPEFNLKYGKNDTPILRAAEIDNHASFILQEYSSSMMVISMVKQML